ncbi:MAG: tetratricopeptide repeat protein [Spirochaetia bacterium]
MPKIIRQAIFFMLCCASIVGQNSTDYYINKARDQQALDQSEQALITLNEGIFENPMEASLFFERGILYFNQRIYQQALHDLLQAEKLSYSNNYGLYNHIAEIYGLQGEYKRAKKYYHKLLKEYPDSEHIIANLLWYYYKTLDIQEGLDIGLAGLGKWPDSSSINSMLALLYASLNQYDQAEFSYNRAVEISIDQGRYREASQTLYNQAIFENEFYEFEKAQDLLMQAVMLDSHPSSYRLIGETYMNQLLYYPAKDMLELSEDLEVAQAEQTKKDRTPLGRLVLVELYLTFNQLDDAKQVLDEIIKLNNYDWITSFGTSKEAYFAWMHHLQYKFWKQKIALEKKKVFQNIADIIHLQANLFKAYFLKFYHKKQFQAFSLKVAEQMRKQHLKLAAYREYIHASSGYYLVQNRFLNLAQSIEMPFAPKALASYMAQSSLIKKDSNLRNEAVILMDPLYEKKKQQFLLQEWIEVLKSPKKRIPLLIQLYKLNRPIVELYGLPVKIEISGDFIYTKKISRLLRNALIETSSSPYTFQLSIAEGEAILQLLDNNEILVEKTLDFTASKEGLARLAKRILFYLYFPAE